MKEFREKFTKEYLAATKRILDSMEADLINKMDKLASVLSKARESKNTVYEISV